MQYSFVQYMWGSVDVQYSVVLGVVYCGALRLFFGFVQRVVLLHMKWDIDRLGVGAMGSCEVPVTVHSSARVHRGRPVTFLHLGGEQGHDVSCGSAEVTSIPLF